MILIDERRIAFVAPCFRVEMQAENEIGLQPGINEPRPLPNLAVPIKENFALPPNGFLLQRVIRSIEVLTRIFRSARL